LTQGFAIESFLSTLLYLTTKRFNFLNLKGLSLFSFKRANSSACIVNFLLLPKKVVFAANVTISPLEVYTTQPIFPLFTLEDLATCVALLIILKGIFILLSLSLLFFI